MSLKSEYSPHISKWRILTHQQNIPNSLFLFRMGIRSTANLKQNTAVGVHVRPWVLGLALLGQHLGCNLAQESITDELS